MLPTLELGTLQISTYALLYALMYAAVGVTGYLRLLKMDAPRPALAQCLLFALLGVFIGSQIPVAVASWRAWTQFGLAVRLGHANVLWGLLLGVGAAVLALRHQRIPVGQALDLGGVPFALGLALGRLGCFAAGCCGGAEISSPLALWMPDEHGAWAMRLPLQLWAAAADLGIFFLLLALERRFAPGSRLRPFHGALLAWFVLLYCAKRFALQFLRADYAPVLGPLSLVHIACLLAAAGCAFLLWNRRLHSRLW